MAALSKASTIIADDGLSPSARQWLSEHVDELLLVAPAEGLDGPDSSSAAAVSASHHATQAVR
ncbi:MAG: hypothetical protein JWN68_1910 [Nocardioides sp.]|jgi:hypothetical protein|uniref:hypothetical protein n=1 Tax=Nocardioides sp. TaxID=35761 RepID=UPI0026084453|nr:hypothetical protein [Nocardioides sp.]MCW2833957.1 hypothetical protein [Nocardioides sp.]